jgi:hypothetical protein
VLGQAPQIFRAEEEANGQEWIEGVEQAFVIPLVRRKGVGKVDFGVVFYGLSGEVQNVCPHVNAF